MRRRLVPILTMAAALGTAAFAGQASADPQDFKVLRADLAGPNEAPVAGDPDAFGVAIVTLDPDVGQVCAYLRVINVDPVTAAHIHRGAPGVAGPIVVPLPPPTSGFSQGCTHADPSLVAQIAANPGGFYVNVHNAPFPGGAARGQLH
jgi:hypothetical protein